jgi:anti-anti-sigma factor
MTTAGVAEEVTLDLLGKRPHLIIVLTGISFFGAAGLHVVVRADARARACHGRLRIVSGPNCAVQRILALTELDRDLTLHPDLGAAVAAELALAAL